jgi:hypothetical protein
MWEIRHATEPAKFSARAMKASWWMGMASLAFGLFIKITSELLEHEVSGVDRTILIGFAKARTPWLTVVAVDLTALGSVTLVVLVSTIALCVLLLLKDRMGALQLVASAPSPWVKIICFFGTATIFLPSPMVARKSWGSKSRFFLAAARGRIRFHRCSNITCQF